MSLANQTIHPRFLGFLNGLGGSLAYDPFHCTPWHGTNLNKLEARFTHHVRDLLWEEHVAAPEEIPQPRQCRPRLRTRRANCWKLFPVAGCAHVACSLTSQG